MMSAQERPDGYDPQTPNWKTGQFGGMATAHPREDAAARALVTRAIREGRVAMVYQPVMDARCTSQVAFHEALLRLRNARGGLIAPGQFLPAVAGTSLAAQLDRIALGLVIAQLRDMPQARLSVNVGIATLGDPTWLSTLSVAASETPDLPYRLIVEVTEDPGFLGHPQCPGFLAALRMMGVSVALDDFGTGATGFGYFRSQRFDMVKIDGSYGDGLAVNPDSQALVRALVEIGRHFEMVTVIEYIESPEDAACAIRLGVDCLQGHLFGRADQDLRPDGFDGEQGEAG